MTRLYKTLIPNALYSKYIEADEKYSFLSIGRESMEAMRDEWLKEAEVFEGLGLAAASTVDRMAFVGRAQYCRGRAKVLENLMIEATSRPSIFRELPTTPGSRITCMLHGTNGAYADCVLMGVSWDRNGMLNYEVRVVDKRPRFRKFTGAVKFKPDLLSVIPTEDLPYLRCHPHFFNLYLLIAAERLHKEMKVEKIVAAVS